MWQRFTERARRIVFFAQEEAGRLGENYVSTEHLLLGLVRENDSVAARILDRMGVSLGSIRSEIERQVTRGDGRLGQDMQLTPRAKRVIDLAYDEARQLSNNYIGTEHLLLGLVREAEGLAGRVLAKLGVELERTREEVRMLQDNDSSKAGARVKPEVTDHAKTFAEEFAKLPEDQKAALTGEGLALNKLPDALRQIVQQTFEASIPNNPFATPTNMSTLEWLAQHAHTSQIRNGTFVLDPNSLVRVNVTEIEGAAHYTVTTKASFLINLLAKND